MSNMQSSLSGDPHVPYVMQDAINQYLEVRNKLLDTREELLEKLREIDRLLGSSGDIEAVQAVSSKKSAKKPGRKPVKDLSPDKINFNAFKSDDDYPIKFVWITSSKSLIFWSSSLLNRAIPALLTISSGALPKLLKNSITEL